MKNNDYENANKTVIAAIKQNPYLGDLYYFLAKTTPDDKDAQLENYKKAMENQKTLTVPRTQIRQEMRSLK